MPSTSFFLVSTDNAGSPRRLRARTRSLMCRNWPSRSGCWRPSRVLRLPCRLYSIALSIRRTVVGLTVWPCSRHSPARR